MAEGSGVDLGHVISLLGTVQTQLGEVRGDVREVRDGLLEVRSDLREVRATVNDHSRQHGDLRFGLTDLHSTVANDHASVLGHGILISEPEGRIARVERHLELPPAA